MRASKLFGAGALLVSLSLFAAACGDDSDDDSSAATTGGDSAATTAASGGEGGATCDGVALGFFGALTGDAANLGVNIKQGAELAVLQFNEANPDCQVELKEFDSQGSPDQAPALAQQAIDDASVIGIIGPAFSGESRVANPLFDEAGLGIITPSATAVDLADQGWTIFHRGLGNDGAQGPGAALYIDSTLGAESVFVIDDASEYGKGLADLVSESLGDKVVGTDTIDPAGTDFSATVTAVAAAQPDAIFFGGYYAAAGLLSKQLRDGGVTGILVFGDGVLDPGYVEAAGAAAAEGAIITCPCAPIDQIEGGDDFAAAYSDAFGQDAGTYSAEAYDAANFFLAGIAAGSQDRESLNTYVSDESYEGLTKTLSFDDKGEVETLAVYASTVEGGTIVSVGLIE
jgi:branched-chain amino acid transport system substrate-binding protein